MKFTVSADRYKCAEVLDILRDAWVRDDPIAIAGHIVRITKIEVPISELGTMQNICLEADELAADSVVKFAPEGATVVAH